MENTVSKLPIYKTTWFWGGLITLVLISGGGIINYNRLIQLQQDSIPAGEPITLEAAPIAGHPAPDFTLTSLEGEAVTLSDYQGTPVVVNFWATWCGPCRAEFPDFQEAANANQGRVVIIGVNNTAADKKENVVAFVDEFKITFPIVLDETGDVVKAYQIFGLPTTVFIDKNGVINEIFTGPVNKATIEAKLSDL